MRCILLLAMVIAHSVACSEDAGRRLEDTAASDTAASETASDTAAAATAASDTAVSDTAAVETSFSDTAVNDTGIETAASDTTGADASEPPPPNISVALDCGDGPPAGAGNANELQRFPLDTATFPDAICNDGSTAVLYFRPYVGEANRDKWLVNLNGGGGCGTGPSCAARWCWCRATSGPAGCPFAESTTNFSMANMDGDERASIGGTGIFRRGDASKPNPIADYNQVRLVYCSSDGWIGSRRDAPLTAKHPKTGVDVAFSVHFLGARILDAAFATLRHDGTSGPRYTLAGVPRDLPDIDDAVEVIVSGDSAGGAGVIANLDRIGDLLRAHNPACTGGGACPLVVRGLLDAIIGPSLERLDFSTSIYAESGGTTYALATTYQYQVLGEIAARRYDESCLAWHADAGDGGEYKCADLSHVIRHHVTNPFFVRMALLDDLISDNYIEAGYSDPDLGLLNLQKFARILQGELSAFPSLPDVAEEGAVMAVAPGVFAPACTQHDTIHDDGEVYGTTITPDGGSALRLFDVFEAWRNGGSPTSVLTQKPGREDTTCGP